MQRQHIVLKETLKIKLIDSMVLNYDNYCNSVYDHCLDKADKNSFERVQKFCLTFTYIVREFLH